MSPTSVLPDPAVDPLIETVRDSLARTGHTCLRRVAVHADGGRVVLRGVVPSYYLKQLAQVTVLALPGVDGLRNELRVAGGN